MRNSILIGFMLVLFFLTAPASYASDDIDDLLYSGIADKRRTKDGLFELIHEVEAKLKQKPADYGLSWMYAALCYLYGDFYLTDPSEKKQYFTLCKDYADKAVHTNPNGVAGHYWLGVGMAKWAEYNGILYSLFSADDILNEMNIVIRLNTTFFKGLPYAIRATVYAMAPGIISVGDWDKARLDIQSALKIGRTYRPTLQVIADIYVYWREWENSKKIIDEALALPYDPRMELEENDCIRKLNLLKTKVEAELAKIKK